MMEDASDMRVSLRDVYDSVQTLGAKMDTRFNIIDDWQHAHEISDAVALAKITSELTAQKDAVALALITTKEAMGKAELAVDKRFEKVDAIARNLDGFANNATGIRTGAASTMSLVFATCTVIAGVAGLLLALR